MKFSIFFLLLCMPFLLIGQDDDEGYVQFEMITLTPSTQDLPGLREKMRTHNQKYHATAPYNVAVWNIATGPNTGQIVWMMGPCTFSDLDKRPSADGHDEDWAKNVMPHFNSDARAEYWRRDKSIFINPRTEAPAMVYVRYHTVRQGQGHRINGLFEKIKATLESMDMDMEWALWDNVLRQGQKNGRHLASVSSMDSWSVLDEDFKFDEAFEKLYGEGSMRGFDLEMQDVFSNSWDEVWAYDGYMSGN